MIEWLRTQVFPEAVQAQCFGADVKQFISFKTSNHEGTDQFASDVVFGDVTVQKENGENVTENVLIKVQPANELAHTIFDCDAQFHNEILFYTKLIPLFRKYDTNNVLSTSFCEFVYGKATDGQNPKEDVIILKNIGKKGFKLTDERLFIDEKHIKLALDRIGKYHALSFKCQSENPVSFGKIVSQIKATQREPDGEIVPKNFFTLTTFRGIAALQNDPKYKDRLRNIEKHCENADYWYHKYLGPSEPLNVITHGDFCRNNMMFRYGSSGEPEEVIFFDLATIKYCSPAIDTSFLLFLNTSPESRRLHWNDFLQTYYDSLSQQLGAHSATPSFEEVKVDLRKKGIYGYYLCSFFLAAVVEAKTKEDWNKEEMNAENILDSTKEAGGPRTTEYLAEMVRHMLDNHYIFDQ